MYELAVDFDQRETSSRLSGVLKLDVLNGVLEGKNYRPVN